MPVLPGRVAAMLLGTDASVLGAADTGEKDRVGQILEHLLPVSERSKGMTFDVLTAAPRAPFSFDRVRCPVLTISAADDRFDTAERARDIAAQVPNGRAIIFPKGGHALVGDSAEALREAIAFLRLGTFTPTMSQVPMR
jgi:pimeloyl-ACP methyl ester carboxylesterase